MKKIAIFFVLVFCLSCADKGPEGIKIIVKNTLDFDRSFETIEISKAQLASIKADAYKVIDETIGKEIISQFTSYDGEEGVLLFQPEVFANSEKSFRIIGMTSEEEKDSIEISCYSRFVPERTDDYAWENNKVAFRTFGPTAQKMKEDGVNGGTLSSGIDAWLKRVDYPIINRWYKKHTSGSGSYHEDTGEGLDNFHVGVSRGVGGTAVKVDKGYAVSKNFVNYKTLTNGPIRTRFVLEYGNWEANTESIKETKTITLDYGQNLSHYLVEVSGTEFLSVGLTLHNKDGMTSTNKEEGWISYWEPYFDSELGQGIVVKNRQKVNGFDKYVTDEKDESNLFAQLIVEGNLADYYAGFGWKKTGQFKSKDEWNTYLSRFSKCIITPVKVEFIKQTK